MRLQKSLDPPFSSRCPLMVLDFWGYHPMQTPQAFLGILKIRLPIFYEVPRSVTSLIKPAPKITMGNMFEQPGSAHEQVITPEFLAEQISLSREAWSDEFKNYIDEKIRDNQRNPENTSEITVEQEKRKTFDRYMKGLNLSIEDLKDKIIIDLGSGDGEFVEECLDRGISEKIYGIDEKAPYDREKYAGNFFKGNFQKSLPVKEADYAVSVGAISAFAEDLDLEKISKNALEAIKKGGEIRIYPIQRASEGSDLEGLKESYRRWNEMLVKMATEENIQWELKPIDVRVSGVDNDVWLEECLIIRKDK